MYSNTALQLQIPQKNSFFEDILSPAESFNQQIKIPAFEISYIKN